MLKRLNVFSTSLPSADRPVRTGMDPVMPWIKACVSILPVKLQLRRSMKEWRSSLIKLWDSEFVTHPILYTRMPVQPTEKC